MVADLFSQNVKEEEHWRKQAEPPIFCLAILRSRSRISSHAAWRARRNVLNVSREEREEQRKREWERLIALLTEDDYACLTAPESFLERQMTRDTMTPHIAPPAAAFDGEGAGLALAAMDEDAPHLSENMPPVPPWLASWFRFVRHTVPAVRD
eukprot:TRINITY_DN6911_c0_g2_i1.p1 TRINITY_DN6911_c0_g2~~TRINITY_DN6911_c0_g2_i1.p1  ORF type:complete len:153 (-),score=18.31 TRINITY_DN6911_c0_g2_i1:297-755(-)